MLRFKALLDKIDHYGYYTSIPSHLGGGTIERKGMF